MKFFPHGLGWRGRRRGQRRIGTLLAVTIALMLSVLTRCDDQPKLVADLEGGDGVDASGAGEDELGLSFGSGSPDLGESDGSTLPPCAVSDGDAGSLATCKWVVSRSEMPAAYLEMLRSGTMPTTAPSAGTSGSGSGGSGEGDEDDDSISSGDGEQSPKKETAGNGKGGNQTPKERSEAELSRPPSSWCECRFLSLAASLEARGLSANR
jgi:hypothetical protein